MTLGALSASECSSAAGFCSCCGAKMVPYFSDDAVVSKNQINQLISESFLTVKGAALFLPRGNSPTPNSTPHISQRWNKHTGDLQKHLQTMFTVLRPEDTIRLAVRLESAFPQVTRYMVVVSTNGRQDTEESIVLGMDFVSSDSCCTVGLVLPLWSDTMIHLDGDGGFSVSTVNRVHVFKPVSVQAMWSALQSLHKACEVARCHNYYPGSLFLTWVSYYQSRISSNQYCVNEWNAMQDVESHRANSPVLFTDLPTERERTERLIKMRLREIMMQKDLENVTCKEIRTELEMQMVCNLREFKEFIDNEMIVILGQMDSPTEIFDHVFLGSEWNASNLEELQNSGVRYILNVTREIDNFFPGMFEYHNIRVYDEEATNLLEYWNETYKFITKAKKAGAKCLVHCKMGVSRSASTVIAYAMKEYGWDLDTAFDYVKEKRAVTKPNPSFMKQLEEYQGILLASKQRHNKLWRSHSDSDLSDRSESSCKPPSRTLARADSHNNNSISSSPSLHHFLGVAVLQALGAEPGKSSTEHTLDSQSHSSDTSGSSCHEEVRTRSRLPRPRAATVIPDERGDSSARVAVMVPVAIPHPPPSIHIMSSTPEVQHGQCATSPLSNTVPKHKLTLDLFEKSSSDDISLLTLGSDTDILDLSDLTSEKVTPLSPPAPLVLSPAPSDDNNNPRQLHTDSGLDSRGEADGSSTQSTDSIDFFSAREKFLGLAQDGKPQKLLEQGPHGTPLSPAGEENKDIVSKEEEECGSGESQSEDRADHAPHHDNGVSVRHIVTEIEAISHPASTLSTTSSSSFTLSSPSLQLTRPEPHIDTGTEPGSVSPPSNLQSPSMLSSDWLAGSVRRATKQLEQKLKQEMAASQRSPVHSPTNENSLIRSLQQSTELSHSLDSFGQGLTQEESTEVRSKDSGKQTGLEQDIRSLDSSDSDSSFSRNLNISQVSGAEHASSESQMLRQTETSLVSNSHIVNPSLHTSTQAQRQPLSQTQHSEPQACSDHMTLDGVTVKESDTDCQDGTLGCSPDCVAQSRLARGSQELEHIQQTLQELQAFLQDGVGLEIRDEQEHHRLTDKMDISKDASISQSHSSLEVVTRPSQRQEGKSAPGSTGWHRAIELEARLRQAGLTPPSLMKRSASLAKLDCLELSATDLSDLDLTSHTKSSHSQDSFSKSQNHLDDSWNKKQKVLAQIPSLKKVPLSPNQKDPEASLCPQTENVGEGEELDCSGTNVAASQKQGRGHSSRRSRKTSTEKKHRAVTVLYNTM